MAKEEKEEPRPKFPDWDTLRRQVPRLPNNKDKGEEKKEKLDLDQELAQGVKKITDAEAYRRLMMESGKPPAPAAPAAPESPFQIKGTMDFGSMVSSSSEMLKSMLESKDTALKYALEAKTSAEKSYWEAMGKSLDDKLGLIKEYAEKAKTEKPQDPLEIYHKVKTIFDEVKADLTKALGAPERSLADPRVAIDLKRMELDSLRELRRLEVMMEEDSRKFQLELKKMDREDNRFWKEMEIKQQHQKELIGEISKGLESVARIMEEKGKEAVPLLPVVCENPGCNTQFRVPQDAATVVCPACRTQQAVVREPAPSAPRQAEAEPAPEEAIGPQEQGL